MLNTFDEKISELERERSELDLSFLESKKQEYEAKIAELLSKPLNEGEEKDAISKFNEVREYHEKIKEIDSKIQHLPEIQDKECERIDDKIAYYENKREGVKNIPLYMNTEEYIAKMFGTDPVYQYAQKNNNTELITKLMKRTLTPKEYFSVLEKILPQEEYLTIMREYNPELYYECEPEVYYDKLLTRLQSKKAETLLPEGMSEEIRELLRESEEFKHLSADEIENFLKKELKKNNGHINDKHIRNKFKNIEDYKAVFKLISYLTTKYPQFKIFKETARKITTDVSGKTKNDRLVSEAIKSGSVTDGNKEVINEKLMKLHRIGKIENVEEKCQEYVNLFEELGCRFCDKDEFKQQLLNAITTQTHIQLGSGVQSVLVKIIQTDLKPEEAKKYGYYSYKLSRGFDSRRIVSYPNGEIFTICPHSEYIKLINKKAPIGKRRK